MVSVVVVSTCLHCNDPSSIVWTRQDAHCPLADKQDLDVIWNSNRSSRSSESSRQGPLEMVPIAQARYRSGGPGSAVPLGATTPPKVHAGSGCRKPNHQASPLRAASNVAWRHRTEFPRCDSSPTRLAYILTSQLCSIESVLSTALESLQIHRRPKSHERFRLDNQIQSLTQLLSPV
jgi:hypothetical protein